MKINEMIKNMLVEDARNMRLNELIEMVGHNDDEESKKVLQYLNSYQNQFASRILRSRISQKMTEQQVAKKVELPLDEYLLYENGINMNASKEKYQRVLNKLNARNKEKGD